MAINMPGVRERSPFDRLLGAVQGVQGAVTGFQEQGRKSRAEEQAQKERAELEDPGSSIMQSIRQYSASRGVQVPENLNYVQFEKTPLRAAIEASIKGEQDRKTQAARTTAERAKDKRLPSDKVLSVNEGKQIPRLLTDIRGTIESNQDLFGPVAGTLASLNPYSERAQTIDAQMRTAAQSFGRYMEGGVLRKEDEEKYRKMFPRLGDTPDVAANKLSLIDRQLKQKLASDIKALGDSGYDVSGLQENMGGVPGLPGVLAGKQDAKGTPPAANAAAVTPEDREALSWAKANPKDPRAPEIMKRLLSKGLQ